jgi:hypothetical protein
LESLFGEGVVKNLKVPMPHAKMKISKIKIGDFFHLELLKEL